MSLKTIVASIIADRPQAIVFRRGDTTLPAQTVRIERKGGQSPIVRDTAGATATETRVIIVGDDTLDVAVGDRFNDVDTGDLYQVQSVHPSRQSFTQAVAIQIE